MRHNSRHQTNPRKPPVAHSKRNHSQLSASHHHHSHESDGFNQNLPARDNFSPTSCLDSDKNLLAMLEATSTCLKQKKMHLEALGALEQSLWLKRRMFGVENTIVQKALTELILSCNAIAMEFLAQDQVESCLTVLRKAEAITARGNFKRSQALQILTFNNLGCCYRKLGKLKSALKYLKEAAQLGAESTHVNNLSITYLNLCAIESQLGRHELALEHAQAAIFHTQAELVSFEDDEKEGDQPEAKDPTIRQEKRIALAVAYHNLAVELEFNGRGDASLQWYKKAVQLAWKYRTTHQALCQSFVTSFSNAKRKQQATKTRQNGGPIKAFQERRRPMNRPQSAQRATYEREVSYSSTVASQCYKTRHHQSEAPAARRRPASATTQQSAVFLKPNQGHVTKHRVSGEPPSTVESALESHWRKLEEKHELNEVPMIKEANVQGQTCPPRGPKRGSAVRRRKHPFQLITRQQKLQDQVYFTALDEEIEKDNDYGSSSDESFDSEITTCSENQWANELEREHAARSQASFDKDEEMSEVAPQEVKVLPAKDTKDKDDTDPDLPAQRVRHLEYLRRMKKLAETIRDDLNGVTRRLTFVHHSSDIDKKANPDSKDFSARKAASKLRKRIQQARLDARKESRDVRCEVQTQTQPIDVEKPETEQRKLENTESLGLNCEARDGIMERQVAEEAASCRLQALFRGYQCRKEVKKAIKQTKLEHDSARLIQRQVRQYLDVKEESKMKRQLELQRLEVEEMAACLLQRLCRRWIDRKAWKTQVEEDEEDEIAPHLDRCEEAEAGQQNVSMEPTSNYDEEQSIIFNDDEEEEAKASPRLLMESEPQQPSSVAALCFEAKEREAETEAKVRDFGHQTAAAAAICIQACFKGFVGRQRSALEFARVLSSRYIEHHHFDLALTHALALEQPFLEEWSAIKIQALVRGYQSRLVTECTKVGVETAVIAIQQCYRAYRRYLHRELEQGVRSLAVRIIQQRVRQYLEQKAALHQAVVQHERWNVEQIAASTIQSFWRQAYAALEQHFEQMEAAICIQALVRGHLTRQLLPPRHRKNVLEDISGFTAVYY